MEEDMEWTAIDLGCGACVVSRELTFGEKAVGLSFNPSGDEKVQKAKELFAAAIDLINEVRGEQRSEQARLCSIAITEAQGAQMWAVKAITWKD